MQATKTMLILAVLFKVLQLLRLTATLYCKANKTKELPFEYQKMKILPDINSKLKLLLFVGLSAICSCNSLNINKNSIILQKESELRYKKKQLVQAMLNLPELQQYFQVQETLKQKELVILKNSCVDWIDSTFVFRLPIKLLSEGEILNDSIKAFVEFKEINLKNDSALVYYRFDVQGIGIESSYVYRNGNWNLIKHHLWEN